MNRSGRIRYCGTFSTYGREQKCVQNFLLENLKGRPRSRWRDDIKMGFKEM
jgi:hypothetical protein